MIVDAKYGNLGESGTCFVIEKDDGYWYAFKGSSRANFTYELVTDGTETDGLDDIETFNLAPDESFESESDLAYQLYIEDAEFKKGDIISHQWDDDQIPLVVEDFIIEEDNTISYDCKTIFGEETDEYFKEDDFEKYADSQEEAIEKYNQEKGIGVLVSFDTYNEDVFTNLTKDRYISKMTEIVPTVQEVKENCIDFILNDTPFDSKKTADSIKTLFYSQPFSDWDEDVREEIVNTLDTYTSEVGELVDMAYAYRKEDLSRWITEYGLESGGSDLAEKIVKNIWNDMKANNFKGASHTIEVFVDLVQDTINSFEEQCPDVDLDMQHEWDDKIGESAASFDLIYGADSISAKGYRLDIEPDADEIDILLNTSTDIAYVESDGQYYIAGTGSELDRTMVAYAYYRAEGVIPEALVGEIKLDTIKDEFAKNELTEYLEKQRTKEDIVSEEASKLNEDGSEIVKQSAGMKIN